MKNYLIVADYDVANEGNVGLIQVVTQDKLYEIGSVYTGFGNLEGDMHPFDQLNVMEITEEEIEVLAKFGLTNLSFGYCELSLDEYYEDDDDE
jgi:hypothetical protein